MKVVLFCGGLGLRLREHAGGIPKPMVTVGYRPVLWHVMRYYAHYGHKDFVLCLGYKADVVKRYFLDYDETLSNDFVLSGGGREVDLLHRDIDDWRITFLDTGLHANVGMRLRAARPQVEGEELFLANYGDTLTNAPLDELIDDFRGRDAVGAFVRVPPTYSFHAVGMKDDYHVSHIVDARSTGLWLNGGYFIFRQEIFDYLREGEELVQEPFQRLIEDNKLIAYRHDGFWAPMDTMKERAALEEMWQAGRPPWAVWQHEPGGPPA
ncbi:MAG TPA: glucose-1-phosphate cytidylyltransferase [Actinomycetota bacterium]|jgi:glucose-1-phosphate cytidylyltransferase